MRLLFVFTGFPTSTQRMSDAPLLDDLRALPTSHMSEVNHLLICHWLREMGHEVFALVTGRPTANTHFPQVTKPDPAAYDGVILFKIHGFTTARKAGLLDAPWRRIVAWYDACQPEALIGQAVRRVSAFAWGTDGLLRQESPRFPWAVHVVCEHATVFPSPPTLGERLPRGLYLGRLPPTYLQQVRAACAVAPMLVHALWVQVGERKILLRPGQYDDASLSEARAALPDNASLEPGVNVIRDATRLSGAAFGLCSATSACPGQLFSASKFYDYLALGLPVVLADNTPEAKSVRETPVLGELYRQGNQASLAAAIGRAMARPASDRPAIQSWVFEHATYKHRAAVIDGILHS